MKIYGGIVDGGIFEDGGIHDKKRKHFTEV